MQYIVLKDYVATKVRTKKVENSWSIVIRT